MDTLRITRGCQVPISELEFRFSRSGGPGGQNVNTRDTRVEVLFDVASSPSLGPRQRARILDRLDSRIDRAGRLRVVAQSERTQAANRTAALDRLRDLVAEALREQTPRRPTRRPRSADRRRIETKRRHGRHKRERFFRPEDSGA